MKSRSRGRDWLTSVFLGAKFDGLKEENLRDYYAWFFFNSCGYQDLPTEEARQEIDNYVSSTRSALGGLGAGHDPSIRMMRPSLDPLISEHHPAIFYLLTEVLLQVLWTRAYLAPMGFAKYRKGKVTYWYHPGEAGRTTTTMNPLVFFPGIGVGFISYRPMLELLIQEGCPLLPKQIEVVLIHT